MAGCGYSGRAPDGSPDRVYDRGAPYHRRRRPMGELVASGVGGGKVFIAFSIYGCFAPCTCLSLVVASTIGIRLNRLVAVLETAPHIHLGGQHLFSLA